MKLALLINKEILPDMAAKDKIARIIENPFWGKSLDYR